MCIVLCRFLSSFLCPSTEQNNQQHKQFNHQPARTFSEVRGDWSEIVRRSSCDDDVPLNLSLSSSVSHRDSRPPQHCADSDPPHRADCGPACTSSASPPRVDGSGWRRSDRRHEQHGSSASDEMDGVVTQHQPALRRPESSPCLHPDLRKSSSAGIIG